MDMQQMEQTVMKSATDVAAAGTVIGTIAGWLPAIAALFSITWFGIQIWESKTGKAVRARVRSWFCGETDGEDT